MSFMVIIVSEIGDKTFLIAAVMALQHSRLLVFSAAMAALLVMTVLSAIMGVVLPELLSKQYAEIAASILFLIFGFKLAREASKMTGNECMNELDEVQADVRDAEKKLEEGTIEEKSKFSEVTNIWIQTFLMTFIAEWGDRSQIATVALSGSQNFYWVIIGGILGHAICSGVAVIGGKLVKIIYKLATRISAKTVNYAGAFLFTLFGIFGLVNAYNEL